MNARESATYNSDYKFQRSKLYSKSSFNQRKHKMTLPGRIVGSQSKINTHTGATPPKGTKKQELTTTPSIIPSTISQPTLTPVMSSTQEISSLQ